MYAERVIIPIAVDFLAMVGARQYMETVSEAQYQEAIYSVVLRPGAEPSRFLEAVRDVNGNNKVSLVLGQQEIDL